MKKKSGRADKERKKSAARPSVSSCIRADLRAALDNDPAARSKAEVILTYAGFHALAAYRLANFFYGIGWRLAARLVSQAARFFTGVEIHPGAKIAAGVFIDHGAGVVIGETAEVGRGAVIYQGVTLGGTGKGSGKRHPTVGENVMLGAGAKILGPCVIGDYCKIGAGSVVLRDLPPHSTAAGVPARIVRIKDKRADALEQRVPDPIAEEFARVNCQIETLSRMLENMKSEIRKINEDEK